MWNIRRLNVLQTVATRGVCRITVDSKQELKYLVAQFVVKNTPGKNPLKSIWDFTQKGNNTAAQFVVQDLHNAQIWTHTWKFTPEKNLLPAQCVKQDSAAETIWSNTWEPTRGRSRSTVRFVVKHLDRRRTWDDTWLSTRGRNPLVALFVVKDSLSAFRWTIISVLVRAGRINETEDKTRYNTGRLKTELYFFLSAEMKPRYFSAFRILCLFTYTSCKSVICHPYNTPGL